MEKIMKIEKKFLSVSKNANSRAVVAITIQEDVKSHFIEIYYFSSLFSSLVFREMFSYSKSNSSQSIFPHFRTIFSVYSQYG